MTWSEQAAHSIVATFDGAFETPGVVVAAAAIDEAGISSHRSPGDSPADGRFEIGSVTKTMTATLLALAVGEGTLSLDDEIGRWLAAGANGGITLRQLATHTSGLPRLAPGHDASRRADPANPYAAYTEETATEGVRQVVVAPGGAHLYSNFGYQLLGLVLERAAGQPYGTLVTQRLLSPLSMTCSGVGPDGGGIPLPGHARGREVPRWGHPLPGPGGLEATIGDLARYAQACLHPPQTPLGAAITLAQGPQLRIDDHREQALGWFVRDGNLRWHNGGTGGFASSVMTYPAQGRAVAVLASVSGATAAAALDQAAFLALAGGDPRQARPQRPGPPMAPSAPSAW
jgi:CubicO group peptidase (beta-lactamase class C family)